MTSTAASCPLIIDWFTSAMCAASVSAVVLMLDDSGCTMSTRSCVGVGAASASGAASTARVERTIAAQHDSTRDGRQARRRIIGTRSPSIGTRSPSAYISCERLSERPQSLNGPEGCGPPAGLRPVTARDGPAILPSALLGYVKFR